MTRVYGAFWVFVAGVLGILYVTGNLTLRSFFAIGVLGVALIFIGMMSVLPSSLGGGHGRLGAR